MDHSTWTGYRTAQHQQQEFARTLELRRRIAERREAQSAQVAAAAPAPARDRGWHGMLVRAHLVRPVAH